MGTILIVDDEILFLRSISEGLSASIDGLKVLTAENGQEAIDILERESVDLLITDLEMPVVNGFQLLVHIMNNHRNIPVIVMTAYGTPEIEKQIYSCGSVSYFEKPIDLNALIEVVKENLNPTAKGYLTGINLVSFLQILQLERKTCTLFIKFKGKQGCLYFLDGVLINAEQGVLEGEDAAFEILRWGISEIEIESSCKKRNRTISFSLDQLLLESAKLQDEILFNTGSMKMVDAEALQKAELRAAKFNAVPEFDEVEIIPEEEPEKLTEKVEAIWGKFLEQATYQENLSAAYVSPLTHKYHILKGSDDIVELIKPCLGLLDIVLQFIQEKDEGVFEYISTNIGCAIVWNIQDKYIFVIYEKIDGTASVWFRKNILLLSRICSNLV